MAKRDTIVSRLNLVRWLYKAQIFLGGAIALICALASIGILLWQFFGWTRTGVWIEMPFSELLAKYGFKPEWPYSLEGWVGLASVVRWFIELHASYLLIIGAVISGFFSMDGDKRLEEIAKMENDD